MFVECSTKLIKPVDFNLCTKPLDVVVPVIYFLYFMFCMLQVIIEGVRGRSFRSDIAIDDVVFVHGSCRDTPSKSLSK